MKKFIIPTAVLLVGGAALLDIRNRIYNELHTAFPDLDRRRVRKAYRKMLYNVMRGTGPDVSKMDDRDMGEYFLEMYHQTA